MEIKALYLGRGERGEGDKEKKPNMLIVHGPLLTTIWIIYGQDISKWSGWTNRVPIGMVLWGAVSPPKVKGLEGPGYI